MVIFLILFTFSRAISRDNAYESLVAGMALYIIANIFGWMAGIESPSAAGRLSGFETTSPFFDRRIIFPLSSSLNEPPYVAVAFLLAVIAMIKIGRQRRWYHWLGAFASAFVLLAANNRATFLIAITLSATLVSVPKLMRIAAPYVAGTALLLPFLLSATAPVINYVAALLQDNNLLSRGRTDFTISEFEGRGPVWTGVVRFFSEQWSTEGLSGISSKLFGYGYLGQVSSGAYLFIPKASSQFLRERIYLHAHNSVLQAVLDVGLIGAIVLWSIAVLITYRYGRQTKYLPMFVISFTIALSGIFESGLVPGMNWIEFVILMYLAFFIPVAGGSIGGTAGEAVLTERMADPIRSSERSKAGLMAPRSRA
jgi:hypothetical protein